MPDSNTDTGDTINTELNALNEKMASNVTGPREALVTTAINFLQNAKVRHTTLPQKQQFLRSKGLTAEEIQLACERAGVFTQDPNSASQTSAVINMGVSSGGTYAPLAMQQRQSAYGRIKEVLHAMALLSGLAYAIYMFWKKFVEPFFFGKRKPIDKSLEDIEQKVDTRINNVNRELAQVRDSLSQEQREQSQHFNQEFNHIRSDLEAIKGLLLNRKQFAAPLTAAGAASIPVWQLQAAAVASPTQLHHHHDQHSHSDDNEKPDDADAGSGSGSSETEVVTKNSDSSLEIM